MKTIIYDFPGKGDLLAAVRKPGLRLSYRKEVYGNFLIQNRFDRNFSRYSMPARLLHFQ